MKAERLFRVLGLIDPALAEEALEAPARRRESPWKRWGALAACLALVCGLGFGWLVTGGFQGHGSSMSGGDAGAPAESGSASGNHEGVTGPGAAPEDSSGGAGIEDGTTFMSYAGPVFPLSIVEDSTGLTAERVTTWDFAEGTYEDGSPRQWGAEVTDAYVLTNTTDEDITVTALYPFAGSFDSLEKVLPTVKVEGRTAEAALYAGAYSGGFQSTFGGAELDTMNLDSLDSWREYKALLEDGAYLKQALEGAPDLDIPVTVYEFSDFSAPHERYQAATQAVSLTIDEGKTKIFTYGFNGMEWDGGFRRYSYFVPDGVRHEPDYKVLIVLGEDIGDYALQGYQDGGCEAGEEIGGVSCTITRRETPLDEVLDRVCRYYMDFWTSQTDSRYGQIPYELYRGAAAELLERYSLLGGDPMDRYGDGRLDDLLSDALGQERVLYLSFPVTVPAGGSAAVECRFWKEPSYDYACSGSGNEGLQGYDLVTRLGSGLEFTRQRAVLVNTEGVALAEENFGFELENGVTEAELDLEQEHYYLELRVKEH